MNLIDIKKLARLARLSVPDDELEAVAKGMDPILEYVAQVQKVAGTVSEKNIPDLINCARNDSVTRETGMFSDVLLGEAPVRDGEYVQVKKIL
jgi:aspartyl-tRNA(Asn)/glutamyl-tRNA(Gln) amidotransferase subunit C